MNEATKRWTVDALRAGQGESVLEAVRAPRPMPAASPGPGKSGMERPKLLFVDDEERILDALGALFRYKYQVFAATSAGRALAILKQHRIHVVVSDQRMPEITGVEFLRQVKEISPHSVRILLTGFSDLSAIIDSVNDGEVYRFLNKPWGNQEIQAVIADAVGIGLELEAAADVSPPKSNTRAVGQVASDTNAVRKPSIVMMHDKRDAYEKVLPLLDRSQPFVYARNLEQCVDALQSNSVAVVVSDLQVDRHDCSELLKLLKREHPQILTIVLADSADADRVIDLINQAKIFRYVLSPCKPQKLKFFIDSALAQFERTLAKPALLRQQRVDTSPAERSSGAGSAVLQRLRALRNLFAARSASSERSGA
jgi:DNA-binding NtrC family response regulator